MKGKLVFASIIVTVVLICLVGLFLNDRTETQASNTKIVVFHYQRPDNDYEKWNVWLWDKKGTDIGESNFTGVDEYGAYAVAECNSNIEKLGFRVRYSTKDNAWAKSDIEEDRFLSLASISESTVHVYLKSGDDTFSARGDNQQVITKAEIYGTDRILFEVSEVKKNSTDLRFMIRDKEGHQVDVKKVELKQDRKTGYIHLKDDLDLLGTYTLNNGVGSIVNVVMRDYYETKEFVNECIYTGNDLGVTISNNTTKFRAWAPTAESLSVKLYKTGSEEKDDLYATYEMEKDTGGTWVLTRNENLAGYYYVYNIKYKKTFQKYYAKKHNIETDDPQGYDAVDPYARSAGENGTKGMIIDVGAASPEGWSRDTNRTVDKITDASIYEISGRDTSSSKTSGVKNKGKFVSFLERGTKTASGVSTGMDHIVNMGVNMVQVMPIFDFASVDETKPLTNDDYNWGYDPANYNVPDGSFSTNAKDGTTRVYELKQMIQAFHNEDIGVIMDVVYNHTYYDYPFGFAVLVPGYFHRPDSNTSGCGNDVATERTMVTKYIVESIVYWAKEYHIDGFRFDLMGLIDLDTMNQVRRELDKLNEEIILYGEGWYMDSTNRTRDVFLCNQNNCRLTDELGFFSDTIRNGLRGGNDKSSIGFIQGDASAAKTMAYSSKAYSIWSENEPYQTINYASCHDNYTLWDKLKVSNKKTVPEATLIAQNKLAAGVVYTSQGVPLMLQGEEFLRTKVDEDGELVENSYNAPDTVNTVDYSRLEKYQSVADYYKGLIEFRKNHESLRMLRRSQVDATYKWLEGREVYKPGVVAFELGKVNGEVADGIVVIYNQNSTAQEVNLPEGDWQVCVDENNAGVTPLRTVSGSVKVAPVSCYVLVKGQTKM